MKNYDVLNELVPKTQELHREIFDKGYEQGQKDILEQQPCEDAVNRQAVLETIDVCNSDGLKGIFCSYDDGERFKGYIKDLPPVTPKEKSEYEHDRDVVKAYNDGQAFILDKIRTEIEGRIIKRPKMDFRYGERDHNEALLDVLNIIDKYRGE